MDEEHMRHQVKRKEEKKKKEEEKNLVASRVQIMRGSRGCKDFETLLIILLASSEVRKRGFKTCTGSLTIYFNVFEAH